MSGGLTWAGIAALGGAGAILRFTIDSMIERRAGSDFPLGTFVVNMSGSFVLGLITSAAIGSTSLFLIGTGLLGSYTTYSTWIFESEQLASDGEYALAGLNLILSVFAGFGFALAGWELGAAL